MNRLSIPMVLALLVPSAMAQAKETIRISASIAPLAAIARDVGGDRLEVTILLPPGADPHTYEPSPRSVARLTHAEAHLVIGLGLDGWAERLVAAVNREAPVLSVGGEQTDPHVWLDPKQAGEIAVKIGELLARLRPDEARRFTGQAERVRSQYSQLSMECAERLEPVREVPFIADHGGLSHLIARFGLQQVGVLEPFPGSEPSPRRLGELVETVQTTGARAIFIEHQTSSRLADLLSHETGARVFSIDLIGTQTGEIGYEDWMRSVVETIATALAAGEDK